MESLVISNYRLDEVTFEQVSEETLDSLAEYLEDLIEKDYVPPDADVTYAVS